MVRVTLYSVDNSEARNGVMESYPCITFKRLLKCLMRMYDKISKFKNKQKQKSVLMLLM